MKEVTFFEFRCGWGSIDEQVGNDLEDFLGELRKHNIEYDLKYIGTGRGMMIMVEYSEVNDD